MEPVNDMQQEVDLRAAVQFAVVQQLTSSNSNNNNTTRVSPSAQAALAELVYLYATKSLSRDLSAFASHAGRRTITEADVKLVARKNPALLKTLQAGEPPLLSRRHHKSNRHNNDAKDLKRTNREDEECSDLENDEDSIARLHIQTDQKLAALPQLSRVQDTLAIDSSEDDGDLPPRSQVQEIMANMSMDSVLSRRDEEELELF